MARTVTLTGGSPWGLTLAGGKDFGAHLQISKVVIIYHTYHTTLILLRIANYNTNLQLLLYKVYVFKDSMDIVQYKYDCLIYNIDFSRL